jgi:hypothetical protein
VGYQVAAGGGKARRDNTKYDKNQAAQLSRLHTVILPSKAQDICTKVRIRAASHIPSARYSCMEFSTRTNHIGWASIWLYSTRASPRRSIATFFKNKHQPTTISAAFRSSRISYDDLHVFAASKPTGPRRDNLSRDRISTLSTSTPKPTLALFSTGPRSSRFPFWSPDTR